MYKEPKTLHITMAVTLKQICKLKTILTKMPADFFMEIKKQIVNVRRK